MAGRSSAISVTPRLVAGIELDARQIANHTPALAPPQFLKTTHAPSADSSRRQMSFAAFWSEAGIRIW
jgi:hypothetical protein